MKEQYGSPWRRLPVYAMILALSLLVFFSCQEEEALIPEEDVTVIDSEISQDSPVTENTTIGDPIEGDPIINPVPAGCKAGVTETDFANTQQVLTNAPFYNNTTLNELGRRNGQCLFPASLNQPCLFAGSITVNNNAGMTGNYRVITPSGAIRNVNNVAGSFTFFYGRPFPDVPLGVPCGSVNTYTVEAENPNLPGFYTKVYEVSFICSNCIFGPIDGQPL